MKLMRTLFLVFMVTALFGCNMFLQEDTHAPGVSFQEASSISSRSLSLQTVNGGSQVTEYSADASDPGEQAYEYVYDNYFGDPDDSEIDSSDYTADDPVINTVTPSAITLTVNSAAAYAPGDSAEQINFIDTPTVVDLKTVGEYTLAPYFKEDIEYTGFYVGFDYETQDSQLTIPLPDNLTTPVFIDDQYGEANYTDNGDGTWTFDIKALLPPATLFQDIDGVNPFNASDNSQDSRAFMESISYNVNFEKGLIMPDGTQIPADEIAPGNTSVLYRTSDWRSVATVPFQSFRLDYEKLNIFTLEFDTNGLIWYQEIGNNKFKIMFAFEYWERFDFSVQTQ